MTKDQGMLTKIAIRLFTGLLISIALYWLTIPAQSSSTAFISFHSLIAFLAVAAAALGFLINYRTPTHAKTIIFIALLFRCFIHFGIAVAYSFFEPDLSFANAPIRAFTDLLSLFTFGIYMLISVILSRMQRNGRLSRTISILSLFIPLAFYGAIYFFIVPILSAEHLVMLNLTLTLAATGLFAISGILLARNTRASLQYEVHYAIAGLLSFIISPAALFAYSIGFYTMWTLSIIIQALGFALVYLSIGEPLYKSSGIGKNAREAILSFLLALSVTPFTLSLLSEACTPGVLLRDIGAYLISHGAAGLLSGMMCILLFVYFKKKPAWNLLPLMILYLSWTFIEIFIMVNYQIYMIPGVGESVIPYIFGGIVSLLVIYRGILFTNYPPKEDPTRVEYEYLLPRFVLVVIAVAASRFFEIRLQEQIPLLLGFPLGKVILMSINILALFGFSILLFITTRKYSDWKTIEGVAIIILAFFIIPGILKGVFLDWTIGWWLGELVLLMGLGVGPPLLGTLYVDSMSKAQDAQRRATLYSDLLVHDITNMHQAILVALSILEHDLADNESHLGTIRDAKRSLERAAEIVSSVRRIGLADQTERGDLRDVDIVRTVINAFNQIQSENPERTIDFSINKLPEECLTKANNLLMDLFYNLFRNSVKYSGEDKRINVIIKKKFMSDRYYWNVYVEDYGRGIEEPKKKLLFQRFMKGAEGIGLGLSVVLALAKSFGGVVEVMDRVPGDHSKGTVFIISLPVSYPDKLDIT